VLWLAAYLPVLPLEVFSRTLPVGGPLAVTVREGGFRILLCNDEATARGIRPGLAVGAAQALAAGLRLVARDVDAEWAALQRLAAWAGQFFMDLETAESALFYRPVGALGRVFMTIETTAFRMAA